MRRCKKITNIEDNYQQLILKKNVTLNIDDPVVGLLVYHLGALFVEDALYKIRTTALEHY